MTTPQHLSVQRTVARPVSIPKRHMSPPPVAAFAPGRDVDLISVPNSGIGLIQRSTGMSKAYPSENRYSDKHDTVRLSISDSPLQTKLAVNRHGDDFEQEADRVADQMMAVRTNPSFFSTPPRIQRTVGRPTAHAHAAPASVDHVVGSPGAPLDPILRQVMGRQLGHDFTNVRVHSDTAAAKSAQDVTANAYTVGNHVVFAPNMFAPNTPSGQQLIAHELMHVIQQGAAPSVRRGAPAAVTMLGNVGVQRAPADHQRVLSFEEFAKLDPSAKLLLWNFAFAAGLEKSDPKKQFSDAIDVIVRNAISRDTAPDFQLGLAIGIPKGIIFDLAGQAGALFHLAWELSKLSLRFLIDQAGLIAEIVGQLKALIPTMMQLLDGAEPLGEAVGKYLGKEATLLALNSPRGQGEAIGKAIGAVITEVALLFIGVEEVTAAARAIESTSLGRAILRVLSESKLLRPLIDARVAKVASKEAKATEAATEAAKAARLEAPSGSPKPPPAEPPPSPATATIPPESSRPPSAPDRPALKTGGSAPKPEAASAKASGPDANPATAPRPSETPRPVEPARSGQQSTPTDTPTLSKETQKAKTLADGLESIERELTRLREERNTAAVLSKAERQPLAIEAVQKNAEAIRLDQKAARTADPQARAGLEQQARTARALQEAAKERQAKNIERVEELSRRIKEAESARDVALLDLKLTKAQAAGGLKDLAARRKALDLGEAGPKSPTQARLDVEGQPPRYGISGEKPIGLNVNAISRTHAEADVLQQVFDSGGAAGRRGTLYVDHPHGLCPSCGDYGAVKSMARQAGISELVVISPSGTSIIVP